MKKFGIMFIVVLFTLSGCGWFQISSDKSELITQITARRIGAELQYRYPAIAKGVYVACNSIIAEDSEEVLRAYLILLLEQEIEDPLLVTDIADLLDSVSIESDSEMTPEQIYLVKTIAQYLIKGIELAGGVYDEGQN